MHVCVSAFVCLCASEFLSFSPLSKKIHPTKSACCRLCHGVDRTSACLCNSNPY